LVSFLPAAVVAVLLCIILDGPGLGSFYDFLLRRRPVPPISRELLIINSSIPGQELGNDILEPGAAASLLYTMTEMGAGMLIIQVPILGLSAGGNAGEEEILNRFDEEFSILSRNIRNLFEGIKTGSVAPSDSARYVGELVDLSEKGKERLVSALVRRDEEGIVSMEKAAAFFGYARRPGDLRVQLIRTGESGRPGVLAESGEYSRIRPDRDGVLRRITPSLTVPELSEGKAGEKTMEHIIYGALKTRYETSKIEYAGALEANLTDTQAAGLWFLAMSTGPVLSLLDGPGGSDTIIPLDRNGAILFEVPHNGRDFRRIGISDFLSYDEIDRNMKRLLLEADTMGIYRGIEGEDNPFILYDYALSIREEPASSFRNGNEEKKLLWQEARKRYFESLENFLYGPAEMNLVEGFERIIASESGSGNMAEIRDSLIRTFVNLRDKYNEIIELRQKLESALYGSFCVLGNTVDMEASALLANSILTGRVVKPGENRFLFLGSLLSALLVCFFVKSLGPIATLGIGMLLTLLAGTGFSLGFIFSGPWLNPMVPVAAGSSVALVSFFWAAFARSRFNRYFRLAYGPFVSRACLKSVIRAGKPLPSQIVTIGTAVVAIKNSGDPHPNAVFSFQEKASAIFKKAGGTITGTEGNLVIACFGSPLERMFAKGIYKASLHDDINAMRAAAYLVSEIAQRPECVPWHFGLDLGNCSFAWSAVSGYFALGTPVQKAKIFARLADRHRAQIVISASAREALPDVPLTKLGFLKENEGSGKEPYYKLAIGGG
jgi:hypothetical protein